MVASNTWVSPSADTAVRVPVVATRIGRSVISVSRTCGLTGVTNGSPWLGRSNGVRLLTQGTQR